MTAPSVEADVRTQISALLRIATGEPGSRDVDVAGVIARCGLDRVADFLTHAITDATNQVAHKRGGHLSPEAILEEYLTGYFARQPDELRQMVIDELRVMVLDQVREGRHPQTQDPEIQELFVLGLLTLYASAVIELAGDPPRENQWVP